MAGDLEAVVCPFLQAVIVPKVEAPAELREVVIREVAARLLAGDSLLDIALALVAHLLQIVRVHGLSSSFCPVTSV